MKTAVIYARYSSDNQTEQSIEGQVRVCTEYAKSHNILILDTYVDRAMTGTNDQRPDFQRMLRDSAKREWDYVLVYKLDRFSRDKYATAIHKKTLSNNGVKVLSAMENIPDTPEGIILESLLEGMNQYYSAELAQKVKRGMNESRKKGLFTGGYLLYGYKVENKKIVVDEEQAEVVRYVFGQYALGVYVKDIIDVLTAKGIYHRGKPFIRTTIYNMLANEKYVGIYRYKGEVFENIYPQIVSKDIFERVKEKSRVNHYGKRSVSVVYLLRNKLRCGYCGQPISAETGTSRSGKVMRYYKCFGRKQNNGCKKATTPKEFLENTILTTIVNELSKPKTMELIVSGILSEQSKQAEQNSALKILMREKKQIDSALENMMAAIEKGIITNGITKRLRELEAQQEELERKILIEQNKATVQLSETDIRKYYTTALSLEAQALIDLLVKEVVLYDDKVEIHFNTPARTSPDENRGFSVYLESFEHISIEIII